MPVEPVWHFYPKYFAELARKTVGWISIYLRLRRIYLRTKYDPKRYEYSDLAIMPVVDDEIETHAMFRNDAAKPYVADERRIENSIRKGAAAAKAADAPLRLADKDRRRGVRSEPGRELSLTPPRDAAAAAAASAVQQAAKPRPSS